MQRAWVLAVLFLAPCRQALAGSLELHGFVQANYASRLGTTRRDKPPSGDFLLGEERLPLQLSGAAPKGGGGGGLPRGGGEAPVAALGVRAQRRGGLFRQGGFFPRRGGQPGGCGRARGLPQLRRGSLGYQGGSADSHLGR